MSARPGTMRLREAVERGDGAAVQQELEAGVPVDAAGRTRWTPLHRAVDRGHVHIVRMLCAANANPNVRTETGGDTPLHIAAAKGDSASVAELLRVGADPRLKAKNGACACACACACSCTCVEQFQRSNPWHCKLFVGVAWTKLKLDPRLDPPARCDVLQERGRGSCAHAKRG